MILADVNVLIAAFRADTENHAKCRHWLDGIFHGPSLFAVSPLALSAVVRITSNHRSFRQPSSLQDAFGFCDDMLGSPLCRIVEPGPEHWGIFQRLCRDAGIHGPMVRDAWFAALAIEHGCEWISFDRDFGRFPGLRWRRPH